MRFSLPRLAAALIAACALPASLAAQERCTSMQVYLSISPNHRENVMAYIAPRLRQSQGVELVAEAIGSANMVERITAQGATPRVSVAHFDFPIGLDACGNGMCKPVDVARAPNVGRMFDWAMAKDAEGRPIVLATNVQGVGIVYNEEALRRANIPAPTSWADLARRDLRGRVALVAPQSTMGTAMLVMLARNAGGGETNIDPGFARTRELQPNLHSIFTWSSELSNLLQLGEVWVAVTQSSLAPAMRAQGVPMRFVLPREGTPTVNGGVSLVRNGPCDAAAHDYLNLYFSDEFQALRMREGGITSPVSTAWALLTEEQKREAAIRPEDFPQLIGLDWAAINAARPGWIQRWQREIR
jgi:putative spermidine/putrescine transport system substrate-binding protein